MQLLSNVQIFDGYTKRIYIVELDEVTRNQARERFERYAMKGVIENTDFADEIWIISDEVKRRHLKFILEPESVQEWTGCEQQAFIAYVKSYVSLLLGSMSITTIAEITKNLMRLGCAGFDEACEMDKYVPHSLSFLSMIPDSPGYISFVIEKLEEMQTMKGLKHKSRELTDFRKYLRFDRYVNTFWGNASQKEKEYFFPVFLWWKLTSILPLRVTEFLLTPRDCIRTEQGRWLITVRRTRLKKKQGQVGYTIEADYTLHEYEIPDWIAKEISEYQAIQTDHDSHTRDTLFYLDRKTMMGYLTYTQMKGKLNEFKEKVTGDKRYPVKLGDTRHLAMINLILSGGSPVICRELAGHESIDISSNYYANLSSVVESIVYERNREYRDTLVLEGELNIRKGERTKMTAVEDGYCDDPGVADGDISECIGAYRVKGHYGDCVNCTHFYPNRPGLKLKVRQRFKEHVDEDALFLMDMIEQVRMGRGEKETILSAFLRLQKSCVDYERILEREGE